MGYSASVTTIQVTGPEHYTAEQLARHNIIPPERFDAVWTALEACEVAGGMGHISWVNAPLAVERTEHPDLAHAIAAVFAQYGFDSTEVDESGNVEIGYWGGDKLGSCWEGMLTAYATGIDPELTVTFIMCGEDNHLWADRIHGGEVTEHSITIQVN